MSTIGVPLTAVFLSGRCPPPWRRSRVPPAGWLALTLAGRFDLSDPALAQAIEARRANVPVDEGTERQVRDMTRELVQRMLARDDTVPQKLDPVWRRGQAAMAAVNVLDFFDPSIIVLHARDALADDWPLILPQLRARL